MKYNIPNYGFRCLLCVLICVINVAAFSQGSDELTPVSRDQAVHGVKCFKKNIRRGRRSKVTQQVVISYSTLQHLLDEANPDSNFQFILIGIDKKLAGADTIFTKNNGGKTIADLHNKEAIIVKFASKTATAMNPSDNQPETVATASITSSLKSTGSPVSKMAEKNLTKRNRPALPFQEVRYLLGRLCPPPECNPL